MKLKPLQLFILLSLPYSAMSADGKPSVYSGISESKKINKDGTQGGALQVMLTIPGVDVQYKACETAGVSIERMPDCLWNGDGGSVQPLKDDLKKKVTETYAQQSSAKADGNSRSPASESAQANGLTTKSKNISIDYMSDPAVQELSKVFEKKLEQALLGDDQAQKDTKTIAAVDHAKFIELYKTELGKSIVNSFTSYCMETSETTVKSNGPDCKDKNGPKLCEYYLISDDPGIIQTNVKSLKGANMASSTEDNPNAISERWSNCIASVSTVCYTPQSKLNLPSSGIKYNESKQKACVIMDFVKTARQSLIMADEQKAFYDKLGKESGAQMALMKTRNVEATEKNNPDTATTVTSKEIEDSYEKKNKDVVEKEMAECIDDQDKIKNVEACKKFVETDPEEKKKALAEFALRQYALQENLDAKLKDDNEVKKYLKDEGYDSKKIDELTKNTADIEKIRNEIKDRFKNEREALIATMADKIKSKTTVGDGINVQNDQTNIAKIKSEIAKRPDDLKQLVHFSNIVSSYLTIESGGKISRNLASLYAEVNNSAKKIGTTDKDQSESIKKKAEEAGLKPKKDNLNGGTNLDIDVLNKILKYATEK